jgi:hypothetical protein
MVSSGGGDPPCVCFGFVSSRAIEGCVTPRFWGGLRLVAAGRRFAAGRAFALVRRFPVVRGFEVARRFAVFRCFEVVRRFTGFRFFRDEREVAARFLRFAIVGSCSGKHFSKENSRAKRGLRAAGYSRAFRGTELRFLFTVDLRGQARERTSMTKRFQLC